MLETGKMLAIFSIKQGRNGSIWVRAGWAELNRYWSLNLHLDVLPLDPTDALVIAALRPPTRVSGLSLADRACLALAIRLELPALTTDTAWANVQTRAIVRLVR